MKIKFKGTGTQEEGDTRIFNILTKTKKEGMVLFTGLYL